MLIDEKIFLCTEFALQKKVLKQLFLSVPSSHQGVKRIFQTVASSRKALRLEQWPVL